MATSNKPSAEFTPLQRLIKLAEDNYPMAVVDFLHDPEVEAMLTESEIASPTREAVLLEVIKLVRNHPDFDDGGPMADAMDQALHGETPKLLVDVAHLARGLKPPSGSPSAATSSNLGTYACPICGDDSPHHHGPSSSAAIKLEVERQIARLCVDERTASDSIVNISRGRLSELLEHFLHEQSLRGTHSATTERTGVPEYEFMPMLRQAESLLRSAYSITERQGAETNWMAFERQLRTALDEQRAYFKKMGCDCFDPTQCWEPCGQLGHSPEHMLVATPDEAEAVNRNAADSCRKDP